MLSCCFIFMDSHRCLQEQIETSVNVSSMCLTGQDRYRGYKSVFDLSMPLMTECCVKDTLSLPVLSLSLSDTVGMEVGSECCMRGGCVLVHIFR